MLKKCMAVMLVIIMAMSGVSAAAETNIIFDLDISSYCNEDGGGTNSRTILKNGLIPVRHSHENGIEYINLDGRGGFTASVPSSYEELTIEMWVKLDEGETETPLLVLYNETETITGLNAAGNKAILLGDSQSDLNSVEWTHLALTLKQSNDTINRCLYINGSAAAEDTATAALSSITDMNIFAYSDKYTDGAIGKFTVYDEICDIQSLYNADKNKFEGEDTDPVYIPVLAGGDADTAPQLISYENQMNENTTALSFDYNDFFIPDTHQALSSEEMSVGMWIKPLIRNEEERRNIFVLKNDTEILCEVYTENGDIIYKPARYDENSMTAVTFEGGADESGWFYLVFTRKWCAETGQWIFSVYKNGKLVSDNVRYGIADNSAGTVMHIGATDDTEAFTGDICAIEIYDTALTGDCAEQKYTEQKSKVLENITEYLYDFENGDTGVYNITSLPENSSITIAEDSLAGGKAMRMELGNSGSISYLTAEFDLPVPAEGDIVEISYDIRAENFEDSDTDYTKQKSLYEFPGVYNSKGKQLFKYDTYAPWYKVIGAKSENICICGTYNNVSKAMSDKYYHVENILYMNDNSFDWSIPGTSHGDKTGSNSFINTDNPDIKKLVFSLRDYWADGENAVIWIDNISIKSRNIEIESISPENGESDVSPAAAVTIDFSDPVSESYIKNKGLSVRKGWTELSENEYTVSLENDTAVISFAQKLDYRTIYTVALGDKEYSFKTAEQKNEHTTTYDFEDGGLNAIGGLSLGSNDSVTVETDTNGSKALKIVKGAGDNLSFYINTPTIGDDVELSYDIRIQQVTPSKSTRELLSFPELRDAQGNKILQFKTESTTSGWLWVTTTQYYKLFYSANSADSVSLNKTTSMTSYNTITSTIKNGGNSFSYDAMLNTGNDLAFINSSAGKLDKLYFEIKDENTSTSDSNKTIIWLDNIKIKDSNIEIEAEPEIVINDVTADGVRVSRMEAAAGKSVVIDAEAINTTEETVIIAALYEDNRLAEVCTGNTLTINVPKGATSYTHHIKLFAWDSLNGLRAVTKDKLL